MSESIYPTESIYPGDVLHAGCQDVTGVKPGEWLTNNLSGGVHMEFQ